MVSDAKRLGAGLWHLFSYEKSGFDSRHSPFYFTKSSTGKISKIIKLYLKYTALLLFFLVRYSIRK